jgi:hypothetical protein
MHGVLADPLLTGLVDAGHGIAQPILSASHARNVPRSQRNVIGNPHGRHCLQLRDRRQLPALDGAQAVSPLLTTLVRSCSVTTRRPIGRDRTRSLEAPAHSHQAARRRVRRPPVADRARRPRPAGRPAHQGGRSNRSTTHRQKPNPKPKYARVGRRARRLSSHARDRPHQTETSLSGQPASFPPGRRGSSPAVTYGSPQKETPAVDGPALMRCLRLGARASPVSALSRWTSTSVLADVSQTAASVRGLGSLHREAKT